MLDMDAQQVNPARILAIGLGGGGSNAINRMITEGLRDVTFWVANTDAQALEHSICDNRHQLGMALTGGLGAGGDPEIGRASAEEDSAVLTEILEKYDMVFLTAGMGGGTGTGSIPVVARLARSLGALTVAIVTKPFSFENRRRIDRAEEGIELLADEVDTMIVIPNDKLLHLVDRTSGLDAGLRIADEILYQATRGVSDIITGNGLINVDFADVRSVMRSRGAALLGCGVASGPTRALEAAQAAVSSPLLDDLSIQGAVAILVNIVGGPDMGFHEVTEAAQYISEQAGRDCDVYWGAVVDPSVGEEMRVTLIATGFQRGPAIRKVEREKPAERVAKTQETIQEELLTPAARDLLSTEPEQEPAQASEEPEPVTAAETVEPAPPKVVPLPETDPVRAEKLDPPWERGLETARKKKEEDLWGPDESKRRNSGEQIEQWIESPNDTGEPATGKDRGPALWRRRPARHLRLPDKIDDLELDGRNPLDIPTFLRKQMD